jgi:hypothetical protein
LRFEIYLACDEPFCPEVTAEGLRPSRNLLLGIWDFLFYQSGFSLRNISK